jgi:hypothetical protein
MKFRGVFMISMFTTVLKLTSSILHTSDYFQEVGCIEYVLCRGFAYLLRHQTMV